MDELQDLRRDIDAIDRELVELFRRRMDVTARVGAYKRERGVEKVMIVDGRVENSVLLELLTEQGVGTEIVGEPRAN